MESIDSHSCVTLDAASSQLLLTLGWQDCWRSLIDKRLSELKKYMWPKEKVYSIDGQNAFWHQSHVIKWLHFCFFITRSEKDSCEGVLFAVKSNVWWIHRMRRTRDPLTHKVINRLFCIQIMIRTFTKSMSLEYVLVLYLSLRLTDAHKVVGRDFCHKKQITLCLYYNVGSVCFHQQTPKGFILLKTTLRDF